MRPGKERPCGLARTLAPSMTTTGIYLDPTTYGWSWQPCAQLSSHPFMADSVQESGSGKKGNREEASLSPAQLAVLWGACWSAGWVRLTVWVAFS